MQNRRLNYIAVVGPTATGKTLVGATVAKALGSEVISVDSQLVYKELCIGVARPTDEEMQGIPHHLIGIVPPKTEFSASNYVDAARPIINRLESEGRIPVLVGGTGFYLRALLQPAHLPPVSVNPTLREELKAEAEKPGGLSLHKQLERLDPKRAGEIHPNDTVRLIRALEIVHTTGQPVPESPREPVYEGIAFGLTYRDRDAHIRKIRTRLEIMMEEGFTEETERLYRTYGFCHALQKAHGYPELIDVLEGRRTLDDALDQIEINIRQYSKRQMTWFRTFPGIQWHYVDEQPLDTLISEILSQIQQPAGS